MQLHQWLSADSSMTLVNMDRAEAVTVTGSGPYTLTVVTSDGVSHVLDTPSYASAALAYAAAAQVLGAIKFANLIPSGDPTVNTGGTGDA